MNKTHQPNFENIRVPVLERMYAGIQHKLEKLQRKLAEDMGRIGYYDILPRNFPILPIEKCQAEDLEKLEELEKQSFDCFWAIEKKKARESDNMEEFYATYKFYRYMEYLSDDEIDEFMQRAKKYCNTHMTTHMCIRAIMEAPNFIEEVVSNAE